MENDGNEIEKVSTELVLPPDASLALVAERLVDQAKSDALGHRCTSCVLSRPPFRHCCRHDGLDAASYAGWIVRAATETSSLGGRCARPRRALRSCVHSTHNTD